MINTGFTWVCYRLKGIIIYDNKSLSRCCLLCMWINNRHLFKVKSLRPMSAPCIFQKNYLTSSFMDFNLIFQLYYSLNLINNHDKWNVAVRLFHILASEIEVQDELNWLRYNIQPWTTVLTKWEKTSNYRITVLQSGVKSLSDFKLYGNPKVDSLVGLIRYYCKYSHALFSI